MKAFQPTSRPQQPTQGTVLRTLAQNVRVRAGQMTFDAVIAEPLDWRALRVGDRVAVTWKGNRAYITARLGHEILATTQDINDTIPPIMPTNLRWNNGAVCWNHADPQHDLAFFTVDAALPGTFTSQPPYPMSAGTTQAHTPALPGLYQWRVKATDTSGNSSPWTAWSAAMGDSEAPDPPGGITVEPFVGYVVIRWQPPTDPDLEFIHVVIAQDAAGTIWLHDINLGPGSSQYTYPLEFAQTCQYLNLFATDYAGNQSGWALGAWLPVQSLPWIQTIVAEDVIATVGGELLVAPTTLLAADVDTDDTVITVEHNNLMWRDVILLQAHGNLEWMLVGSEATGTGITGAGPYQYTVTRDYDGTGPNSWTKGDGVFNTGQVGDSFIDIRAQKTAGTFGAYGPVVVAYYRENYTPYDAYSEIWAAGNLQGLYDYTSKTYGFAAGRPAFTWIALDSTDGLRIMNENVCAGQWAINGDARFGPAADRHIFLTGGDLYVYNGANEVLSVEGDVVTVGRIGDIYSKLVIQAAGISMWYGQTERAVIASNSITLGDTAAGTYVYVGTSGISLLQNSSAKFAVDGTTGNLSLAGNLEVGTAGVIRSGATGILTGNGYYLDYNAGTPRLRIGSIISGVLNSGVYWDGSNLQVNGDINAFSGYLGDLQVAGTLDVLEGGVFCSGCTDYQIGAGWWMDNHDGTPRFFLGSVSDQTYLDWTGAALNVKGTIYATTGTLGNLTVNGILSVGLTGVVSCGATGMGEGVGWWMGYNAGYPSFFIGNSFTNVGLYWYGAPGALVIKGLTITEDNWVNGDILLSTDGRLMCGATNYLSGNGYYLDYNSGTPRFRIGTISDGDLAAGMKWDGAALTVMGTINATAGYFGTGSSVVSIENGGLVVGTAGHVRGGQSAYNSGIGFWLGYNATQHWCFSIGNSSGARLCWSETAASLVVAGQVCADDGYFGGSSNGVAIDSTGLTIMGTGYFRTAANVGESGGPAGFRVDGTYVAGYSGGTTKQVYIQASTGKLYAGGGEVILDADGVRLLAAAAVGGEPGSTRTIKWKTAANVTLGRIGVFTGPAGGDAVMVIVAENGLANNMFLNADDQIQLTTTSLVLHGTQTNVVHLLVAGEDVRIGGGLYVGGTATDPVAGTIEMYEISAPAAPVANGGRLFLKDNGSGKTQLCIRFATGATQIVATEP